MIYLKVQEANGACLIGAGIGGCCGSVFTSCIGVCLALVLYALIQD